MVRLNYHCHGIFFGFRVWLSVKRPAPLNLRRAVPPGASGPPAAIPPGCCCPDLSVIGRSCGRLCDSGIAGRFLWVRTSAGGAGLQECGRGRVYRYRDGMLRSLQILLSENYIVETYVASQVIAYEFGFMQSPCLREWSVSDQSLVMAETTPRSLRNRLRSSLMTSSDPSMLGAFQENI